MSSTRSEGSNFGQGAVATSSLWPSARQHSSARCGIIGAIIWTSNSSASRRAWPSAGLSPARGAAVNPPGGPSPARLRMKGGLGAVLPSDSSNSASWMMPAPPLAVMFSR